MCKVPIRHKMVTNMYPEVGFVGALIHQLVYEAA